MGDNLPYLYLLPLVEGVSEVRVWGEWWTIIVSRSSAGGNGVPSATP